MWKGNIWRCGTLHSRSCERLSSSACLLLTLASLSRVSSFSSATSEPPRTTTTTVSCPSWPSLVLSSLGGTEERGADRNALHECVCVRPRVCADKGGLIKTNSCVPCPRMTPEAHRASIYLSIYIPMLYIFSPSHWLMTVFELFLITVLNTKLNLKP